MSDVQYVCIEHMRAMAETANCCQSLGFLPAALTTVTARRGGGPIGAYYRDPEERAFRFHLESLSNEQREELRRFALARLTDHRQIGTDPASV